jgi:hypothetical protein
MNSYRHRQIDELEVLRSMFPEGDVEVCNSDVELSLRGLLEAGVETLDTFASMELCLTVKVPFTSVSIPFGRKCRPCGAKH